jgi:flagellar biosynthesis/type III secretory pathway protein FliH
VPANEAQVRLPRRIAAVRVVGATPSPGSEADQAQARQEAASAARAVEAERDALRSALAAVAMGAAELSDFRRRLVEETDEQLFLLAVGIARKVLMQEIEAQHYRIDPIVREALCHVPTRQEVVVRLNPSDYARCEMVDSDDQGAAIHFMADPDVAPAECILETPEGIVESSVEGHLAGIAEALRT